MVLKNVTTFIKKLGKISSGAMSRYNNKPRVMSTLYVLFPGIFLMADEA
jgi:hypothetical protein